MTNVVIIILAAVWAVVLLPPWLRKRSEGDPTDSIVSFRRQLSMLGRTTPAGSGWNPSALARARARAERRRRRREILLRLAVATGFTFVLAILLQGLAILLFVAASGLLVSYAALLVRAERQRLERHTKVRYLPQPDRRQPDLLLRRSASQ